MKRLLLLIPSLVLLSGCTTTTYTDAQVTFNRTSLFNKAQIGKLQKTKDGILLEGYVNDQVTGAALITGAAVEAALKGAK